LRGAFSGLQAEYVATALKDAEHLLHDILEAVDTSKDGLIQYSEFKSFIESADRELWRIFTSVDLDRNGKIDKQELQVALGRAGLVVDASRLKDFFDLMDRNNDGVISFEEWRYARSLWASFGRIRT
jgi:solute carrier family 25 (mitochondrial phosphate transporter), member 23/24/25/41